jgi:hypothetical protein
LYNSPSPTEPLLHVAHAGHRVHQVGRRVAAQAEFVKAKAWLAPVSLTLQVQWFETRRFHSFHNFHSFHSQLHSTCTQAPYHLRAVAVVAQGRALAGRARAARACRDAHHRHRGAALLLELLRRAALVNLWLSMK